MQALRKEPISSSDSQALNGGPVWKDSLDSIVQTPRLGRVAEVEDNETILEKDADIG